MYEKAPLVLLIQVLHDKGRYRLLPEDAVLRECKIANAHFERDSSGYVHWPAGGK